VAESRIEVPFLAAFMILCAAGLLFVHGHFQSSSVTLAAAVSMIVFGATIVRVDFGIYVLVASMLLSPEIDLGTTGAGDREINVRYDDILIIVIFFGALVKSAFEGRERLWRQTPVNAGIVSYYLVCIISTLLALRANLAAWDRRDAFFVMLKMVEFYMVFFLVGNALRDMRDVRRHLTFFFMVAMIVCGYCIATSGSVERVGTPFEAQGAEPNTLGGYLIIVMCAAGGLYTQSPARRLSILFVLLMAAAFVPFLLTLSRASYIGLLVAILALGILARKASVILAVVTILVLSPVLMPPDVKDRVNYTFQRGSGEPVIIAGKSLGLQVDKSTHERLYVWEKVKYTLSVAPWFGGGVSWGKVLDSQYARVVMETGLLGLAAFLFLQYRLYRTAQEAFRWSRDWVGRGLAVGALAATIGLITHSLGTISFLIIRIMEPYWFLMALTVVVRAVAVEEYAIRMQGEQSVQRTAPVALQSQGAEAN
jgi:O-antigen ligase